MKRMMKTLSAVMFATLLAAASAGAQEASKDELAAQIRELQEKVAKLEQQGTVPATDLEEIRRQIDILTRQIEELRVGSEEPALAESGAFGLGAAASKVYRTQRGVSIGGYGEMVYENYAGDRDDGVASGRTDQLDFLRAILYAGYKFNDRVLFNSEIEFEHATTGGGVGEVSVEFAYLDFMVNPAFNVRAGMVLLPIGLTNELHEPTAFPGARRPEVEQQIIPSTWRENGAGVFGEIGTISYRAYVTNSLDAKKFTSSGIRGGRQKGGRAKAEDFALSGRLDWHPLPGTIVGGSIFTGGADNDAKTPAGEPFDATVTIGELHADAKVRGWQLRALWATGEITEVAALNASNGFTGNRSVGEEFGGWYAEAGYDLGTILPIGEASVTPFARYEELNPQEGVPSGFALDSSKDLEVLTLGVAWKPIPQAVIKLDWQDYENGAGTGVDQINLALGYIF
jgi:outer membrane murein-binding lipoprotein Lpp